ncbi:MAG: maleylpyruvate isomerase N-terminal domain-containing protein, partial [Ilumatobacteraceae bacterium]
MNDLDRDLAGAARAHRALIATLQGLTDEQARRPSLLPGWTVGHVATHIARNADGHMRMFEAAGRGDVAPMYPGGREQRTHDIEAGSKRSARELVDDVSATAAALEATWAATSKDAWSGRGEIFAGELSMTELLFI